MHADDFRAAEGEPRGLDDDRHEMAQQHRATVWNGRNHARCVVAAGEPSKNVLKTVYDYPAKAWVGKRT